MKFPLAADPLEILLLFFEVEASAMFDALFEAMPLVVEIRGTCHF